MTLTLIALFPDSQAAQRAVATLGRSELSARPTRLLGTAGDGPGARLELQVEAADAPRATALLRQHGAAVAEPAPAAPAGTEPRAPASARSPVTSKYDSPLAGWGLAVADAVTAAMQGVTASDAALPSHREPTPELQPEPEPRRDPPPEPPHNVR